MAVIACDPEACREAVASLNTVATLVEEQVGVIDNVMTTVLSEGAGHWTVAYAEDVEALKTQMNTLLQMLHEIGSDLQATASGFEDGDTTSAGYFSIV